MAPDEPPPSHDSLGNDTAAERTRALAFRQAVAALVGLSPEDPALLATVRARIDGPVKDALGYVLTHFPEDVVFRTVDGRRLTAADMLAELERGTPAARGFLGALTDAALTVVGLRARRDGPV